MKIKRSILLALIVFFGIKPLIIKAQSYSSYEDKISMYVDVFFANEESYAIILGAHEDGSLRTIGVVNSEKFEEHFLYIVDFVDCKNCNKKVTLLVDEPVDYIFNNIISNTVFVITKQERKFEIIWYQEE